MTTVKPLVFGIKGNCDLCNKKETIIVGESNPSEELCAGLYICHECSGYRIEEVAKDVSPDGSIEFFESEEGEDEEEEEYSYMFDDSYCSACGDGGCIHCDPKSFI